MFFTIDALSIIMLIVLAIVCVVVFFHSFTYLRRQKANARIKAIYYLSLLLFIAALALGYISGHIVMTWVFTEVTTLAAGVLIYHHRASLAIKSVWKYVFVCAISVTFIFIGILFWSLALLNAGSTDLSYTSFYNLSDRLNPFWLGLGFVFIFTGYTAKIGLFPMFTAGIDAKDSAPSPSAAMLSSVLVNLGFVGIYRAYAVIARSSLAAFGQTLIIVTALITLFVATVYMVKIANFKRMLAYSSIEHSALVSLGMVLGPAGCAAAILHLVMHSFIKSGLFLHYPQLAVFYGSKSLDDMGDYFNRNPFGAVVLVLGLFCITAVPPSGLFVSELGIFSAMIQNGNWLVLILTMLFLTVLIWAICKSIFRVVFLPAKNPLAAPQDVKPHPFESVFQLLLFILAIAIGYFTPIKLISLIAEATFLIY